MSRAVHGLHSESLLLNLEQEKVILVVLVMSGSLPEFEVENVRRHNFLVASNAILRFNHINKLVVDDSSHGVLESTSRGELVHVEETLSTTDSSVVTLLGFLEEVNVLIKFLLGREGDSINTLERVILSVRQPVGGGVLKHFEGLNVFSRRDMRSSA
jgi:hypothetical protein